MIVGSHVAFTISEQRTGLRDKDSRLHETMPFVVLRTATLAEYLAYVEVMGVTLSAEEARLIAAPANYFYEISVD